MRDNDYPNNFIKKIVRNRIHKLYNTGLNNGTRDTKYLSIPYTPFLSEKIGKILKQYDVKIVHKPNNTLKNIYTKLKDPIELVKQANAVYKVPCIDCPGSI